ncbi:MAG TPA: hypothetical protein DEA08_33920 [Planctomycetes bacterium]|nr:hypothetical protein [Planctomycetota bacterium]
MRGYERRYRMSADPGVVALQRVETEVRLLRDGRPLVEYVGAYWEWFRFAAEDGPRVDIHDFDMRRDGWSPGRLRKLLARHGLRDPGGDGVLECRKRFLFLPGRVRDERSLREGEGGFGFLEEVRGLAEPAPPGAQLRLFDLTSDQPPAEVPGSWQPGPRAWAKGQGEPLTPDSGWSCVERYALRFATQRVELDDGGGYVEWSSSEGTRSPL